MEETALQLLRSNKPSHRWVAIDRLRHEGTVADLDELRIALQVEAVPMLRKQLSLMIRRLSSSGTKKLPRVQRADHPGPSGAFQDDVIHWMRHELEPGIGWLLLAASDEVPDFDGSETRAAIDGLWMRLNSIESLVRASAPPRLESVSLSEVVFGAVRISGEKHDRVGIDISSDKSDDILTDGDLLLSLIHI